MLESLTIGITGACNLHCEYCYNPDRCGKITVARILKYVALYNPSLVNIGGGEPMLHDGLAELVKHIANNRNTCISTNGTMLNDDLISLPEKIKEKVIMQVSIPSGIRKVYAEITGKDALETVIGITEAYSRTFRTFINCPVYSKNLESVESVLEIGRKCKAKVRLSPAIPLGNGKHVKLLDEKGIAKLKYFAVKGLLEGIAFSPLADIAPLCPLFYKIYSIQGKTHCRSHEGKKVYIDQHERKRACEFIETK